MKKYIYTFLIILLTNTFISAKTYKGAELRTNSTFKYGRFEVRMKSVEMSGMLSSFFTYHEISSLAGWNEIDIEIMGRYNDEVQFNTITPNQTNHVYEYASEFNPHNDFHVYAIEWTPHYVAWFVDSVEVYRQTEEHISTLYRAQKLMMNIWPPNYVDWAGNFDASELPAYAFYDWVQYYAYTPSEAETFTLQWRDDFNSFNSSRWSKGTHTWDGNNCDFITANAAFYDGHLVLCLTTATNTGYSGAAIEVTDTDNPYLCNARFYDDEALLTFSEKLDPVSAQETTNYLVPGLTVETATLESDQRSVILKTSGRDKDIVYNLFVLNVQDQAEIPNTIAVKSNQIANSIEAGARINVAGAAVDSFLADQIFNRNLQHGYSGGDIISHGTSTAFSNTDDDEIYQSELRGVSLYSMYVPNGIYDITLMCAETEYTSSGQRVFSVKVAGETKVENLDIYQQCGTFTACEIELEALEVTDNLLEIYFDASAGEPVLSGIQIKKNPTAIEELNSVPESFSILAYPNPFNPAATIEFQLQQPTNVKIDIFDILGNHIQTLTNTKKSAGQHRVLYEPKNISSGVYFCRVALANGKIANQKLVYIK